MLRGIKPKFGRGLDHQARGLRVCGGPPTVLFIELVPTKEEMNTMLWAGRWGDNNTRGMKIEILQLQMSNCALFKGSTTSWAGTRNTNTL